MTKVLGDTGCNETQIDGVSVCVQASETIILRCLYSLDDVVVTDNFEVSGHDQIIENDAESFGQRGYQVNVEEGKGIGDTIKFTIRPLNPGIVFATVKKGFRMYSK